MASKKDYVAFSKLFTGLGCDGTGGNDVYIGRERLALALMVRMAGYFAKDNKLFDRNRFVDACREEFWINSNQEVHK